MSYTSTHPAVPCSRARLEPERQTPAFTTDELMDEAGGLFGYAIAGVGDHHLAEDLVQDVLLVAWGKRCHFDERSKLSTWLIGILKFKILDHFRAQKRTPTAMAATHDDAAE